jgi:hypothetical protein
MRRSICFCEPSFAYAGQTRTWKFIYTTASNLKKGARLKFDLLSNGRDIDWDIPDVDLKKSNTCSIYAISGDKDKVLKAKEIDTPDSFVPQYEFVLTEDLKSGEIFTIFLGAQKGQTSEDQELGARCQTITQRRRPFLLYIDPKGKGNYEDPEIFGMDIRGNFLEKIRILAPSIVAKNKRFDVVIRFEDVYDNLTENAPEGTLVELSYENIRENLNWKLFVPETGFITIPNFYFNEAGVFKIQLTVVNTGEKYFSSPIKCFNETNMNLFWGILHGESERVDSSENIESCLRHFRDDRAYDFFSSSSFESTEETPNDVWKLITQNIADFNEDERFTSFLGFQWQGENKGEGLRQLIYTKDNKAILRKKDSKYNSLNKIYKSFSPSEMLSIPSFTMGNGMGCSFDNFNPEFEPVVEIYNAWGSSECTEKEGNTRPISHSRKGVKENVDGSVQKALAQGLRFGFVAGGLDDRGGFTDFFESDQEQYSPGLTAILCSNHTRESMIESLYKRSCYATTGEKLILEFSLAGNGMGSELNTTDKPGLMVNRHLSGFVAGTSPIKVVEIIRNGDVIKQLVPEEYHFEFTHDDMEKLQNIILTPKDKKQAPFVYYYLRVTLEDGHMAWSSPIWVDETQNLPAKRKPKEKALL